MHQSNASPSVKAARKSQQVPSPGTYNKFKGFATTHGQMFEVKVSALLFLKGIKSGRRFQLASNVEGVGAFDDVLFRLLSQGDNNMYWITYFFQLKHKDRAQVSLQALTADTGHFSLIKYLKAFAEARDSMLAGDGGEILNGKFEACHFAIFTNANFSKEVLRAATNESLNVDDVVKFDTKNEFIFGVCECPDIVSCLERTEMGEVFLKKLKIFSREPSVNEIDDLITSEIASVLRSIAYQCTPSEIKRIACIFVDEFYHWCTESNVILDENSDILHKAISKQKLEIIQHEQTKKLSLDVAFRDTSTTDVKYAVCAQHVLLHIIPANACIEVSCSKLLKVLADEKTPFLFTGLECFLREKGAFLSVWRGTSDNLLVIAHDTTQSDTRQGFMDDLLQVLKEDSKKRVVFVSPEDNSYVERFETELGDRFKLVRDDFKLSHLTSESLEKALQTKVTFQGREVEKRVLVGDVNKLTSEVTNFVLSSKTESIGKAPPELNHFFIPRTLKRPNLKKSIFKSINLMDKYAISGITEDKLQRMIPYEMQSCNKTLPHQNDDTKIEFKTFKDTQFIVLSSSNSSNHFRQLCESDQSVHWLHMEDEKLMWRESHGSISEILQFVDEDQFSEYKPSTLLDIEDRIVLLLAEPGMGKSTLLCHLAQQTKETHPSEWVVHISLNDYPDLLDNCLCSEFKEIDFMKSVAYIDKTSLLENTLFEHCLINKGNVTICIDGVDEISESCLENFRLLFTHILKLNVKKIWITSRHSRGQILENLSSTIAFSIQMFTLKDQVSFFADFWSDTKTTMNSQQQKEFLNQIIRLVNSSISHKEQHIMGIPLQTKMLAEIFQVNYENPYKSKLPEKLDVLSIYEMFVAKKYKIAYEEKCKNSLVRNKKQYRVYCENADREHMVAALVILLDRPTLRSLHDKTIEKKYELFVIDLESGDEKNGVIVQVVNGQTQFVHKTFAEYYVGIWLADNYRKNKSLLKSHFCLEEFQMVRNIFDRKLLSCENLLHKAVLNGDASRVERLLDSETEHVNSRDMGGRTALHLAATLGPQDPSEREVNLKIIKAMLTKGADITLQEKHVLKWTPLRYADETEAYEVIETILENEKTKGHDVNVIGREMSCTKNIINNKSKIALITVHGFLKIMDFLFDNGLDVNTRLGTEDESSIIHTTVRCGHGPLLTLLIGKDANLMSLDMNKQTPLHIAVWYGQHDLLPIILKSISDNELSQYVNTRDKYEDTAMHLAAHQGHVDILRLLVTVGGDLELHGNKGSTLLHQAAFNGHLSVAQYLLENISHDSDIITQYVNTRDRGEDTAMHLAAHQGHVDIMRLLVSVGGDLELHGNKGSTLLHHSAFNGHFSVAQYLLENISHDSDIITQYVNTRDRGKDTAMHFAALRGHVDIMRLLVSVGGDLELRGDKGSTLLHQAALNGHLSVAQYLLENISHDSDIITQYVITRGTEEDTAMHSAALGGHVDIMRLLVSVGGDLELRGDKGSTLLHQAAFNGHLSVCQYLLENISHDSDIITQYINTRDTEEDTAMHSAAQGGHVDIMRLLVSVGGDLESLGLHGQTLLHRAACNGHLSVCQYLLENISNDKDIITQYVNTRDTEEYTAMKFAAYASHVDIMRLLVSAGGDLEARDSRGWTPLHHASINGHLHALQLLLSAGGDLEARDSRGWTPLHHVSLNGHLHALQLLLSAGGDIKACTSHNSTTLTLAAEYGHTSVVELILDTLRQESSDYVPFINILDNDGESAVFNASRNGHFEIVKVLSSECADVTFPNKDGKTALHEAAIAGHLSVVEVLIESFGGNTEAVEAFLDARDQLGQSALIYAERGGHVEVVNLLRLGGCNDTFTNKNLNAPLH